MAFELTGHTALATGSSAGLGKAIALELGRAGAKVAVNYFHNTQRAENVLAEFQQEGIESLLVQGDVTDPQSVERMFERIETDLGPVDIVLINATPDQPLKPIEEYDWNFYQSMLDCFVRGPYLLARRALPNMKQQRESVTRIARCASEKADVDSASRSCFGLLLPYVELRHRV